MSITALHCAVTTYLGKQLMNADFPAEEDGENVEEITLGLPPNLPAPAGLSEQCQINRYLLLSVSALVRDLIDHARVDSLFLDTASRLQGILGCSGVEMVVHDPVGQLAAMIHERAELSAMLTLTADSFQIESLFGEPASVQWLTLDQARDLDILTSLPDKRDVCIVPLVEQGVVVGSINFADPADEVLNNDADFDLLAEFGSFFSRCIRRVSVNQELAGLVTIDPATHVTNRNGFERGIEREIDRARRTKSAVSLVAVSLCGLEKMSNLSQRHLQSKVLRRIASQINEGLRSTDSMGRLSFRCFGVLVADAPIATVRDIAWRLQQELRGQLLDDGVGGAIEIDPGAAFVSLDYNQSPEKSTAWLANQMIEAAVAASVCADVGNMDVIEAMLPENSSDA